MPFRRILEALAVLFVGVWVAACGPSLGDTCSTSKSNSCGSDMVCQQNEDFPAASCTAHCTAHTTCPGEGACTDLASGSWCLKTCQKDSDCKKGWVCADLHGTKKVCVEEQPSVAESAVSCAQPSIVAALPPTGPATQPACQIPTQPAAFSQNSVYVQHVGVKQVGSVVSFDVPAGSYALSIVSQAQSMPTSISFGGGTGVNGPLPLRVRSADGRTLFDPELAAPTDTSTALVLYPFAPPVVGTLTLPNTSAMLADVASKNGLQSGTWQFTVNDLALECSQIAGCTGGATNNTYDVTVIAQRRAPSSSATLDVGVYLVGGSLTATAAAGDAHMQRAIKAFANVYARAGICVGTVTLYDVPAWARAAYSDIDLTTGPSEPCDPLSQMFTLSRAGSTNGVNFFMVDTIALGQGTGTVIGIDGTIPGPSGFAGTVASGAAVSMANLGGGRCPASGTDVIGCGADNVGFTMAHEGGHWLGLYHTTEASGDSFDPLVQTASCKCDLCTTGTENAQCRVFTGAQDGYTIVLDTDCNRGTIACGGADNLMFWLVSETSTGHLSDEQGTVMRSNPAIH